MVEAFEKIPCKGGSRYHKVNKRCPKDIKELVEIVDLYCIINT